MLIMYTPNKGAFPDLLQPHAALIFIWFKLQILRSKYTNMLGFFVVYLVLKLKKHYLCVFVGLLLSVEVRSVHQLLKANALWCVFMLNGSYCLADLIQRRVSSKPVWRTKDTKCWRWHFSEHRWVCSSVCVHKRPDSPTDKPVYCSPNFETPLHLLSALIYQQHNNEKKHPNF